MSLLDEWEGGLPSYDTVGSGDGLGADDTVDEAAEALSPRRTLDTLFSVETVERHISR